MQHNGRKRLKRLLTAILDTAIGVGIALVAAGLGVIVMAGLLTLAITEVGDQLPTWLLICTTAIASAYIVTAIFRAML
jgi:hypothetical protein